MIGRERLRGEGVTGQIRCYVKEGCYGEGGDSAERGASEMEEGV